MARVHFVSLVFFIALICHASFSDGCSRKLLEKREVTSITFKESPNQERVFSVHLTNTDRILQSIPSPVCNVAIISLVEARKLSTISLEKREIPSPKSSFLLRTFIKGLSPPAPSDEDYATMGNYNQRLFSVDLARTDQIRILEESVPSPGIGH
ncbi:hypothetical protein Ddye_026519 [Dipteronia dyeriana]|uniref:Uncharacterized protein n=1 Tax=Dipteronia dyeriana TaxID=168575 RepID=A0AAD9TMB0_9ROSI|nr:hypothetical protein Ddye_026519 [Dipteronia dyeriana]